MVLTLRRLIDSNKSTSPPVKNTDDAEEDTFTSTVFLPPAGYCTVHVMLVLVQAPGPNRHWDPDMVTLEEALAAPKPVPVMVTDVPCPPEEGDTEVTVWDTERMEINWDGNGN